MKLSPVPWLRTRLSRASIPKMAIDTLLLVFCYQAAYWLRTSGEGAAFPKAVLLATVLLVPIKLAVLTYYGQYRFMWRYVSVREFVDLAKSATWGLVIALALPSALRTDNYSRQALCIDWLLMLILLGGARIAARLISERGGDPRRLSGLLRTSKARSETGERARRVLIYGAGDAGEMIAREMTRPKRGLSYVPIGIVDDNPAKHGMSLHGLRVFGGRDKVNEIVREHKVDEIVITIPSARGVLVRQLVRACEGSGAQLKIVPDLSEIVGGKVHLADIRGLKVEDLLGREKVDLNLAAISQYLNGRRVLVTGAGGSIGSELCRQIIQFQPTELMLFGRGENSIFKIHQELSASNNPVILRQIIGDVINRKKLAGVFRMFRPEIIFHAGADKHVPLMEMNPDEAVLNNIVGTQNLVDVAEEYGAERVVCISTDKAVNPTSVMGCCKRAAEMIVQQRVGRRCKAVAVRFGNVLGSRGSVIPVFQEQIARGGPVTVTHPEIRRYFMTIPEASQLVIQAGAMGEDGELFILDMGEPVKIADLARDMVRLAGHEPDIDIPIRFSGLRPGEKLNEELVLSGEICEPTLHEKITCVRPGRGPGITDMNARIRELTRLAVDMDYEGIIEKLKGLVPEFEPCGLYRPPQAGAPEPKAGSVEPKAGAAGTAGPAAAPVPLRTGPAGS